MKSVVAVAALVLVLATACGGGEKISVSALDLSDTENFEQVAKPETSERTATERRSENRAQSQRQTSEVISADNRPAYGWILTGISLDSRFENLIENPLLDSEGEEIKGANREIESAIRKANRIDNVCERDIEPGSQDIKDCENFLSKLCSDSEDVNSILDISGRIPKEAVDIWSGFSDFVCFSSELMRFGFEVLEQAEECDTDSEQCRDIYLRPSSFCEYAENLQGQAEELADIGYLEQESAEQMQDYAALFCDKTAWLEETPAETIYEYFGPV